MFYFNIKRIPSNFEKYARHAVLEAIIPTNPVNFNKSILGTLLTTPTPPDTMAGFMMLCHIYDTSSPALIATIQLNKKLDSNVTPDEMAKIIVDEIMIGVSNAMRE